ncbi:TfoX/Sxy family protein [Pseudomonas sp. HK3]
MRLQDMKGLGPKSAQQLIDAGIDSPEALKKIGPVAAYLQLQTFQQKRVSLNFLYALVGAVEDVHWQTVAAQDKSRLIQELEGFKELQNQLDKEGVSFRW